MKKKQFLAILLFLTCKVCAQNTSPKLSLPIPPSPNAASLGKYGEIPVSKYTGVPDISIPLYQIIEGDIQTPISLSYHASGIKVEENASWVGLGWSLNAGGVITRSVRGLPDEQGYLLNRYTFASTATGQNKNTLIPPLLFDPVNLASTASYCEVMDACEFAERVREKSLDSEPDIYYFNFNGITGKFVLDQYGKAYTIPYQKIDIQRINDNSWKITTSDGMQYLFANIESTVPINLSFGEYGGPETDNSGSREGASFISAWYLSKITSPKNHEITFTYESENSDVISGISQSLLWTNSYMGMNTPVFPSNSASELLISGARLKQINFSNGNINFIADEERQDVFIRSSPGPKMLNKISISNSTEQIKQFVLDHDYFTVAGNEKPELRKRLRLNSITEWNGLMTKKNPPYIFKYDDSHPLPARNSSSQDHWGYYNGKTNIDSRGFPTLLPDINRSLFNSIKEKYFSYRNPTSAISDNDYPTYTDIVFKGADRSSDFEYAKSGVLNKITYPTGGYTEFLFESHDYNLGQKNYNHETIQQTIETKSSNDNNINQGQWTTVVDNGTECVNKQTFTPMMNSGNENSINRTIAMDLSFSFVNQVRLGPDGDLGYPGCCGFPLPIAVLTDVTLNKELLIMRGREGVDFQSIDSDIQSQITAGVVQIGGNFQITHSPGQVDRWNYSPRFTFKGLQLDPTHTYSLKTVTYHNQPSDCSESGNECKRPSSEIFMVAHATLAYSIRTDKIIKYNGLLGGVRIKQISDYSNVSSPVIKKYSYVLSSSPLISSGVISDLPEYLDQRQLSVTTTNVGNPNSDDRDKPLLLPSFFRTLSNDQFMLTSGSKFELGQTSGSFVGYKEVHELFCENNNCAASPIGEKKYYYSSFDEFPDVNPNTFGYVFWGDVHASCSNPSLAPYVCDLGWRVKSTDDPKANYFPFPPKSNYDWKRGLLMSEEIYNTNRILVRKTESIYNLVDEGNNRKIISGIKLSAVPGARRNDMLYSRYDYIAAWNYKKQDKVTEYDPSGANPIETTTNYYYDNPDHAQITRTEIVDSKGDILREKNKYVGDENAIVGSTIDEIDAVNKLKSQFRYSILLEKENTKNGLPVDRIITGYKDWGGNLISAQTTYIQSGANMIEPRIRVKAYDNHGNIKSISKENGPNVCYVYSYNNQFPIAEIKNAEYTTIEGLLGGATVVSNFSKSNPTDAQILSFLAPLRNGLPHAQVTTYSYKPLVGMTSSTDAKGMTTYYEYDEFQHLKNVKDQNGNTIKSYEYNYKP